jgi:hypothetical protein
MSETSPSVRHSHGTGIIRRPPHPLKEPELKRALAAIGKRPLNGKEGIRQAFVRLVGDVPDAQWELKTVFADDILFLEWSADSAHTRVEDGIDTFVFRDGLIRVQTVRYTLQHKD